MRRGVIRSVCMMIIIVVCMMIVVCIAVVIFEQFGNGSLS